MLFYPSYYGERTEKIYHFLLLEDKSYREYFLERILKFKI